ncbi:DUF6884 domain-containing protein [Haladaptatus sp. YSMS36]|uniref:DUF6884 domain-containing protein n=1 Tax=Haladaptatus sp. YSMS36 TaxID=3033384 RepID=UPI0023E761A7|nr:DUF6884 domain-containing protein [Haladaptatus sp. YSMS36]
MSLLLVQSCSNSKNRVADSVPALDLYAGYFYKIIKKATRNGAIRSDLDLRILSAKHGLLHPETKIGYYDRRMDTKRGDELRDDVIADLRSLIQNEGYNRVVINMGREYRAAIHGFDEGLDVSVDVIEGAGIGHKGHVLKRVIRGDDSALEVPN